MKYMNHEYAKQYYINKFWKRVDIKESQDECWNWKIGKDKDGYGIFNGINDKSVRAHRFAFACANNYLDVLARPKIPNGLVVMHLCDNPACCNPKHLKLDTYKENCEDMFAKGRSRNNRFNYNNLPEAKHMRQEGYTWRQIADKFNVSQMAVYRAVTGEVKPR